MAISLYGTNAHGGPTLAFGTALQMLIPPAPDRKGRTLLTSLTYLDAGTAHTLTLMRPLGRTTVVGVHAAEAAVASTAVTLAYDPGLLFSVATQPGQYGLGRVKTGGAAAVTNAGLAVNDFLAIREKDGVTRLYKASTVTQGPPFTVICLSVYGTGLGTAGDGLVAGCVGGEDVWLFGVTTDFDPRTGLPHPFYPSGSSSGNVSIGSGVVATGVANAPESIIATIGRDEPLLINSNNATATGKIVQACYGYAAN